MATFTPETGVNYGHDKMKSEERQVGQRVHPSTASASDSCFPGNSLELIGGGIT